MTDRDGSGGLELSIARVNAEGCSLARDSYRIVSVIRGEGEVMLAGIEQAIESIRQGRDVTLEAARGRVDRILRR